LHESAVQAFPSSVLTTSPAWHALAALHVLGEWHASIAGAQTVPVGSGAVGMQAPAALQAAPAWHASPEPPHVVPAGTGVCTAVPDTLHVSAVHGLLSLRGKIGPRGCTTTFVPSTTWSAERLACALPLLPMRMLPFGAEALALSALCTPISIASTPPEAVPKTVKTTSAGLVQEEGAGPMELFVPVVTMSTTWMEHAPAHWSVAWFSRTTSWKT
jgi:hypothetical protein